MADQKTNAAPSTPVQAPGPSAPKPGEEDLGAKAEAERIEREEDARKKRYEASAKQQDKATAAQKDGAVQGAKAVADAVSRVADAAVDAAKHIGVASPAMIVSAGGNRFEIRGDGFGSSGVVKFNGVQAQTRGWGSTYITGELPAGLPPEGEVSVQVDEKTERKSQYRL